jgi:transcriptional regulator GlxA family with amidase domain
VVILPKFNAMATVAFIDPFRAANYLSAKQLYTWRFLSLDAVPVVASNAVTIADTTAIDEAQEDFDFVVVSASWTPENHRNKHLFAWLRNCARRGSALGGIDTGIFILGFAGLLKGYRSTVHYEHVAAFKELFPENLISEDLFVIDQMRFSSCGGAACADLALEIIRTHQGINLANAAARYIFHDRLRSGAEQQNRSVREPVGYTAPQKLREAIVLMERSLEDPLQIPEIARAIGVSQRHMERTFHFNTGVSPVRYYLDLRLDRARGLVTQTDLSVLEISIASGFATPAQFAKAYKRRFSLTPTDDRIDGRIPFQFRSFPSHATPFTTLSGPHKRLGDSRNIAIKKRNLVSGRMRGKH